LEIAMADLGGEQLDTTFALPSQATAAAVEWDPVQLAVDHDLEGGREHAQDHREGPALEKARPPIDSFINFALQHHFVGLLSFLAPQPTTRPRSRNRGTSSGVLPSEEDGAVDLGSAARLRAPRRGQVYCWGRVRRRR
jgi:hypothetical protein